MALEWLKIEHDAPDKPEIMAVAARLGVTQGDAFLGCFRLWRWADRHTLDGCAPGVTSVALDALLGWPGFAVALAEVGWLDIRDGVVTIPKFDRHISESAKRRASSARRMALSRGTRNKCCAASATDAQPDGNKSATKKKNKKKSSPSENNPLPPLPPNLDTDAFREAWPRWVRYRKGKGTRHALSTETAEAQLAKLARWGEAKALESIRRSIEQGWLGLFDPLEERSGHAAGAKPVGRDTGPSGKWEEFDRLQKAKARPQPGPAPPLAAE